MSFSRPHLSAAPTGPSARHEAHGRLAGQRIYAVVFRRCIRMGWRIVHFADWASYEIGFDRDWQMVTVRRRNDKSSKIYGVPMANVQYIEFLPPYGQIPPGEPKD